MNKIALMLNTCDKYSDVWPVFFEQIKKNWGLENFVVYINTESKEYPNADFEIKYLHSKNTSWSGRLKNSVLSIDEEYIINIPEECIIEEKVDINLFRKSIEMMQKNKNIASICYVKIPGLKYEKDSNYPFIRRKYDYRNLICQQCCIWRKDKWIKYIKNNENPWEYEILGSARGIINNDEFYCISDDAEEMTKYNYGYLIYRGNWCLEEINRLKKLYDINFDLSARPVLPLDEIKSEKNYYSWFEIRIKKYFILCKKIFLRRNNL